MARPQRFLAHMALADGSLTIAYCANPGSLGNCLRAGSEALLWDSGDPARKRRYTWRAIRYEGVWVGTDTHLANRLTAELLQRQLLCGLEGYEIEERETRLRAHGRLDFLLRKNNRRCFLEVKNAISAEHGVARFPDSITPRGLKHLGGLTKKAREGHRAVLLFLIQRNDVHSFTINGVHQPAYSAAVEKALRAGVEVMALSLEVSPEGFANPKRLRII